MKPIDICLLLEGTYPYVRGGVSSWVHQLISGLPQYQFYLVFVGGSKSFYGKQHYELPANVVGIEEHYLMDKGGVLDPRARVGDANAFTLWKSVLSNFQKTDETLTKPQLAGLLDRLGQSDGISYEDFLYSEESWEVLVELYMNHAENQSFVDYFWTFRNIYSPLFTLAKVARGIPPCRLFHSISTGYAGFLGALVKQKQNVPYILTEHGIYTKERKIDLTQATWIKDRQSALDTSLHRKMEQTRQTWIQFFEQLGRSAYHQADDIIALYGGNRQRQIQDGAPEHKTSVIVNGINMARFIEAHQSRPQSPPKVAGLIGRVVPIKDIKTFIRSIRVAVNAEPELEGWIIGPTEEDPGYVKECELLISSLGLTDKVKFLGMQNVAEILPKIGVCMLTSISEAQPLVLLEAMAAGIPCIATDVGSCREIIEGMEPEDRALGECGYTISIADPNQASAALIKLLSDEQNWREMGDNGYLRVQKYYQESMMYESYQSLYKERLAWQE
ncbi:GT4 family glycosyltransferase PelF [Paraferrimonas sedimenticola]|uniref:Pellicle/biofilm biosynthesis glycosyltransferase PelF n=1 Tax=Paraferrimonas sedimenticola TaxID=375674 RepID=A0AA37W1K5_9GAMM|nr:GT4 family glycosyltransferase PelF [Paraferrimonas sedimenticola]GLP96342.1 pellicle/biofilm biosynthesis glycosyltransferase PelF [Paraferrimonas sedimenticola]